MSDPRQISIRDYTYSLPDERIARFPLEERDASKILIYRNGIISEDIYRNIAQHIPANTLVVFNDTRVIEARLLFKKTTGGVIEIFCLEPHEQYADVSTAMLQKEKVLWQCLVGGASKWKHGQVLEKMIRYGEKEMVLSAEFIEKRPDLFIIQLKWSAPELCFAELLHLAGEIPLPPYLKRSPGPTDSERYQTLYAKEEGSVAAPTAGLHFTENIFRSFSDKKIQTDYLTLHVGAATFKPVKAETMGGHSMHAEWIDVSRKTIQHILENLGNIIAVGTTSLRTLESLFWLGILCKDAGEQDADPGQLEIGQWMPYKEVVNTEPEDALAALLTWMDNRKTERLVCRTSLLIVPGYRFRVVNGLVTNFHQPQSTLLLLVAALVGEDWRKVYKYAMENDFRFLSYGDGCLLFKPY